MADEDKTQDRDDQDQKTQEQEAAQVAEKEAEQAAKQAEDDKDSGKIDREEYDKIQAEHARMKAALKKANEEAAKSRHDLKPYRDLDVDPDTVKALLKEREEAEIRKAEEAGEWEKLREKLKTDHQKDREKLLAQLEEKDGEVSKIKAALEKHLVDAQLTAEIAKHGAKPKLLMPHVRDRVKAVETEDGDYKVAILDENGELQDGLGIADLIESAKKDEDLAGLFPAPEKSGTGTSQRGQEGADKGRSKKYKRRSEMSQEEKQEAITTLGISGYNKLPL